MGHDKSAEDDKLPSVAGVVLATVREVADTRGGAQAKHELGQSAATVARLVNNMLLPVAAVNFAFDKARLYFQGRFQSDLSEKLAATPPDDIVEPKASIAAPVLEGLAFAHDEPALRELFLDLLKNAMNRNAARGVHPAFSEVIRQLSAEEAAFLRSVLAIGMLPVLRIGKKTAGEHGAHSVRRYLVPCSKNGSESSSEEVEPWIDNWQRLGLIEVDFMRQFTDKDAHYRPLRERKEYLDLKAKIESEGKTVDAGEGIIVVTAFGQKFGEAIS